MIVYVKVCLFCFVFGALRLVASGLIGSCDCLCENVFILIFVWRSAFVVFVLIV